ncbi:MAG TPA: glycosyltransferase family 1 protein [Candidatus Solibacter sp.]|nr:glycosyltransferase family 1 protein [Candidatus Solibacter sp.]
MANNGNLAIAFDTWSLGSRFRNHGIYVYTRNLLESFRQMAAEHSVNIFPLVCSGANNDANAYQDASGFHPRQARLLRFGRLWRFGGSCVSAFAAESDVMFCPSGTVFPVKGLVPVVATIHDVTPVVMPSHSRRISSMLRFQLRSSAKYSRALITDSECSKQDLINIYRLPESKISVVHLGYDKNNFNPEPPDPDRQHELLERLAVRKPYVLHHGMIQPRKNLVRLIKAYRLMLERNGSLDLDLVLAGPMGWQYDEILSAANEKTAMKGRVVFPGALSDADLALLIKGASLSVIPSLYEGFCLPMVESMACGVPTIAADTSCLPEISGNVLRYFDPLSVEDMAAKVESAVFDTGLRQQLRIGGLDRVRIFSWERCARETLAVLIAAGKHSTNGQGRE